RSHERAHPMGPRLRRHPPREHHGPAERVAHFDDAAASVRADLARCRKHAPPAPHTGAEDLHASAGVSPDRRMVAGRIVGANRQIDASGESMNNGEASKQLGILMYHSLDTSGSALSVAPDVFSDQMDSIARAGFRGVSLSQALSARAPDGSWPAR